MGRKRLFPKQYILPAAERKRRCAEAEKLGRKAFAEGRIGGTHAAPPEFQALLDGLSGLGKGADDWADIGEAYNSGYGAAHAAAPMPVSLEDLEVLAQEEGGPYFPLRHGDRVSFTAPVDDGEERVDGVTHAEVRVEDGGYVVRAVGPGDGAIERAQKVMAFLVRVALLGTKVTLETGGAAQKAASKPARRTHAASWSKFSDGTTCTFCDKRLGQGYSADHGNFCSLTCADDALREDLDARKARGDDIRRIFGIYDEADKLIGFAASLRDAVARRGAFIIGSHGGAVPVAARKAPKKAWDIIHFSLADEDLQDLAASGDRDAQAEQERRAAPPAKTCAQSTNAQPELATIPAEHRGRVARSLAAAKSYRDDFGGIWGEHDFEEHIWAQGGIGRGVARDLARRAHEIRKAMLVGAEQAGASPARPATEEAPSGPRKLTPWQRRAIAGGFAEYQSNNADRWAAGSKTHLGKPYAAHKPPLSAEEAAAIGFRFVDGTESSLDRKAAVLLFSLPLTVTVTSMSDAQADKLLAALDPTADMARLPDERSAISSLQLLMPRIRAREALPRISQAEALKRIAGAFRAVVHGIQHEILDEPGEGLTVDFVDRRLDNRIGAVELRPEGGEGREAIADIRMEAGAPEDEVVAKALDGVIVLPRETAKKRGRARGGRGDAFAALGLVMPDDLGLQE